MYELNWLFKISNLVRYFAGGYRHDVMNEWKWPN